MAERGPPEIRRDEIHFNDDGLLGEGGFGKVYVGLCREQKVAIKVSKPGKRLGDKQLRAFKDEVSVMSQAFHPNIVLFMGACTEDGALITVSEFVGGGDLSELLDKLRSGTRHPMSDLLGMARDIAVGLNWLHHMQPANIIHRDIKPANLLLDMHGRVKLCDFGLSSFKNRDVEMMRDGRFRGSPMYMAPEVLSRRPFNEKVDQYSFALVLWELCTNGGVLFPQPFCSIEEFRYAVVRDKLRPEIPPGMNPAVADLISACWAHDPHDRPEWSFVIDQLTRLIVDESIEDPTGRDFWKARCISLEGDYCSVDCATFSDELLDYFSRNYEFPTEIVLDTTAKDFCPEMRRLTPAEVFRYAREVFRRLLAPQEKETTRDSTESVAEMLAAGQVSLFQFGKILKWVGPIVANIEGKNTVVLFDNLAKMISRRWFHGPRELRSSVQLLTNRPIGTFLVRFSRQPGAYTVSKVISTTGKKVEHERIQGRAGVLDIVRWVEENREAYGLLHACEGSPFLDDDDSDGYKA